MIFAGLDRRRIHWNAFAFATNWTLQARIANVFDKRCETAAFYNQRGREWSLSLRFAPQR
jgi:vitamin B12 transporter